MSQTEKLLPELQYREGDPILAIARWLGEGRGCALATVTATWGSSPRPTGSQMAISDSGEMVGSVSGGCVENAVVDLGLQAIADGKSRAADYGITDDVAWEVGLACGGKLDVFVEAITR